MAVLTADPTAALSDEQMAPLTAALSDVSMVVQMDT
jgi:hypothetical protein